MQSRGTQTLRLMAVYDETLTGFLAGTWPRSANGYDLLKLGPGTLWLQEASACDHRIACSQGWLRARATDAGSSLGTATVELSAGSGLRLDAVAATDTPMGTLLARGGAATLHVNGVSGGGTWTAAGLARENRAVLTVRGTGTYSPYVLTANDKFKLDAAPAVINGIIAPHFVESSGDFLTYNAAGRGIERVAAYTAGDINAAAADAVYSAPAAQTLTADREIHALKTGSNIAGAGLDLTLGSGGLVASAGTPVIDCNLQCNDREGVIWNSVALTLNGAVKGVNGLTKAGSGTLTVNATNLYAGVTTLNAGVLQLGVSDALPADQPLALMGATLDLNGRDQALLGGLALSAGTIQNSSATASTLTMSGRVVYDGVTRVNIAPDNTRSLSAVLAGPVLFDVTDGLDNPDLRIGYYANYQHRPVSISGTASIVKNGAGTLSLRGANTFVGTVTVNQGMLVGDFPATGVSPFGHSANAFILNGNGTLFCTSPGTFNLGTVTFSGNNTMKFSVGQSSGSWTIPSVTRASGSRGTFAFGGSWDAVAYYDYLGANIQLYVSDWMANDPSVNGMLPAYYVHAGYQSDLGNASHVRVNAANGASLPANYDRTTLTGALSTHKVDLAAAASLADDLGVWALRTSFDIGVTAGSPHPDTGQRRVDCERQLRHRTPPALRSGWLGRGAGLCGGGRRRHTRRPDRHHCRADKVRGWRAGAAVGQHRLCGRDVGAGGHPGDRRCAGAGRGQRGHSHPVRRHPCGRRQLRHEPAAGRRRPHHDAGRQRAHGWSVWLAYPARRHRGCHGSRGCDYPGHMQLGV